MGAHEDLNRYRMTRVCIEDEAHAELHGEYPTFEEAVLELERRALVPWDQPPNVAPCTSWRTCGRRYEIVVYDEARAPWNEIKRVPMLEISASGVNWTATPRAVT
jgi:hypothetical protein